MKKIYNTQDLNNLEASYSNLLNYEFKNCIGSLIINRSNNELYEAHLEIIINTIKVDNPHLNITRKLILYSIDNDDIINYFNKIQETQESIELNNCIFNKLTIKIDLTSSFVLNQCSGILVIEGIQINSNIDMLMVESSNFELLSVSKLNLGNVDITENSKGNYEVFNNKVKNLKFAESDQKVSIRYSLLKPFYFFPLLLLLTDFISNYNKILFLDLMLLLIIMNTIWDVSTKVYRKYFSNIPINNVVKKISTIIYHNIINISPLIMLSIVYLYRQQPNSIAIEFVKTQYCHNNCLNISATSIINQIFLNTPILSVITYLVLFIVLRFITLNNECVNKKLEIEDTQINTFNYIAKDYSHLKHILYYFFLNYTATKVNITDSKIEKIELINVEGLTQQEKILFLIEKNNFRFSSFTVFQEYNIQDNREYEKLLTIKNLFKDKKLNLDNSIHSMFGSIFYFLLISLSNLFYRLKNILLSVIAFILLGTYVLFIPENMTVTDTTTQIFIKENNPEINPQYTCGQSVHIMCNIKDKKESLIEVPEFYPEYSSSVYTMSLVMPFVETETTKLYRPNNEHTEVMAMLFKLFKFIYLSALLFLFGKKFLKLKSE